MTISLLAHAHVQANSTATIQTPDIDTTGANQLVVSSSGHADTGGGYNAGISFNDISDNLGNVYLPLHGVWDISQGLGVLAWGCHNPTVGSAHHVIKTDDRGSYAGISFLSLSGVYSGALTAKSAVTNSGTGGGSGGGWGSLSITPPSDGNVIFVAALEAGAISGGGFSSWTERYDPIEFVSYGGGLTAIVQTTATTSSPSIAASGSPPVTSISFSMAPANAVTDTFTYGYKRALTINHAKFSADVADFTVMVKGAYSDLATVANGGHVQSTSGHDIVFYSDSSLSNRLSYEQAKYDPATGDIIYWVKVPAISATTDTVIYLAYGDATASATRANPTHAWDADFAAVHHFGDSTTLNYNDSTESQGTLWAPEGTPVATAGKINGGVYFDGSSFLRNDVAQLGSNSGVTISFWLNHAASDVRQSAAFSLGRSQDVRCSAHVPWEDGTTYFDYGVGFASPGARITWGGLSAYYGTWVRMSFVYDKATDLHAIYANGVLVSSFTSSVRPLYDLSSVDIGGWGGTSVYPSVYAKAKFDEFTVSRIGRSASWLFAEHANQNDPATFYTMGTESSLGGTPDITGTGTATVPGPSVTGTGQQGETGTGTATAPYPAASGDGTSTPPGTDVDGTLTAPGPQASGTGTFTPPNETGSGTATAPAPGVQATGKQGETGSGTATVPGPNVTATGQQGETGTGTVTAPGPQASGTINVPSNETGSGTLTAPGPQAEGSGGSAPPGTTGSGEVDAPGPSVTGTGHVDRTGTGTATAPGPSVSVDGTVTPPNETGSGTATAPAPGVQATGKQGETGTVTVTAPGPQSAGVGKQGETGSGSGTAPAPSADGTGKQGETGQGTIVAPGPQASGTGVQGETGTGSPAAPRPGVSATVRLDSEGSGAAVIGGPTFTARGIVGNGQPSMDPAKVIPAPARSTYARSRARNTITLARPRRTHILV